MSLRFNLPLVTVIAVRDMPVPQGGGTGVLGLFCYLLRLAGPGRKGFRDTDGVPRSRRMLPNGGGPGPASGTFALRMVCRFEMICW